MHSLFHQGLGMKAFPSSKKTKQKRQINYCLSLWHVWIFLKCHVLLWNKLRLASPFFCLICPQTRIGSIWEDMLWIPMSTRQDNGGEPLTINWCYARTYTLISVTLNSRANAHAHDNIEQTWGRIFNWSFMRLWVNPSLCITISYIL